VFGLSLWQILIVVAIGFLVFGVGGSKKLFRRGANRVKDTGDAVKGAAAELQSSYTAPADENSAAYRAARTGREKATEGATAAIEAAKEAREEIAGLADDAKASAGGAEPQTAIGRAAKSVGDTARDVRAGVAGDDEAEGYEPQTKIGKAAQSAKGAASARVEMLGETAQEFRAGIEGEPAPEAAAPADEPAALPAADEPPAERA
jgi:Sec-independent protein translocase protein TatA